MPQEKSTPTKKAPVRRTSPKKRIAKGESYACEVCGLVVSVDDVCGCAEAHEVFCCGKPMQQRTGRAKSDRVAAVPEWEIIPAPELAPDPGEGC